MKTWAVVDVDNVARRMFHAIPSRLYRGERVEAVVGFAREMKSISAKIDVPPSRFVFCADHSDRSPRRAIVPSYKANRDRDEGFLAGSNKARKFFVSQMKLIVKELLPVAGYERNKQIWRMQGLEADDLIASVVKHNAGDNRFVIVSNDKDLYQLLSSKSVRMFDHRSGEIVTKKSFVEKYGVLPSFWPLVKAIAGCSTDEVPGVKGVAELTAIKYLTDENFTGKALQKIHEHAKQTERNLKVVSLPIEGTPALPLIEAEGRISFSAGLRLFGEGV